METLRVHTPYNDGPPGSMFGVVGMKHEKQGFQPNECLTCETQAPRFSKVHDIMVCILHLTMRTLQYVHKSVSKMDSD